jgi:hypothetical protein
MLNREKGAYGYDWQAKADDLLGKHALSLD